MAKKQEHLEIIKQGVEAWNHWRQERGIEEQPDLRRANLERMDLHRADLSESN